MKKLIYFLLITVIPSVVFAQNSGYMGKKIFIDAAIRFDPKIDANLNDFGLGYDITVGRTISDRIALACNYTVVNRNDYYSNYIGLNVQFYRSSYVAPVGKMWFIGAGVFNFEGINNPRLQNSSDPKEKVKGKYNYLNFGHEYRTIIKGGNIYFITQFVVGIFIGGTSPIFFYAHRDLGYSGKLGFGVLL